MIAFRTCESGGSVKWRSGGWLCIWRVHSLYQDLLEIGCRDPKGSLSYEPASQLRPPYVSQSGQPNPSDHVRPFILSCPIIVGLFVTSIGPTLMAWLRSNWVVLSPFVQIATTQSDFVRFKETLTPTNQQGCSCFVHVFPCFFHPKFGYGHGWSAQKKRRAGRWMAWLVWLNPRVETMGFYPSMEKQWWI